jgi:hypothetical protein
MSFLVLLVSFVKGTLGNCVKFHAGSYRSSHRRRFDTQGIDTATFLPPLVPCQQLPLKGRQSIAGMKNSSCLHMAMRDEALNPKEYD